MPVKTLPGGRQNYDLSCDKRLSNMTKTLRGKFSKKCFEVFLVGLMFRLTASRRSVYYRDCSHPPRSSRDVWDVSFVYFGSTSDESASFCPSHTCCTVFGGLVVKVHVLQTQTSSSSSVSRRATVQSPRLRPATGTAPSPPAALHYGSQPVAQLHAPRWPVAELNPAANPSHWKSGPRGRPITSRAADHTP